MNMKASVLLLIGVGWITAALVFWLSGIGIGVPGWIPLSLVVPAVFAFEALISLGWLVPMVVGIRLLTKGR
jgi:hypothetical protein